MEIKKVSAVCYSATGNTKAVTCAAAEAAAQALGVPFQFISFNTPKDREAVRSFTETDLVFVGTPTYAGKMPNKLLPEFQEKLHGCGTLAAALVTFGNRSFDNALAELCSVLEGDAFHTLAGGAFACQHAFAAALAAGRPNAEDLEEARQFGRKTAELAKTMDIIPAPVQVPGDASAPYYVPKGTDGKPAKFLKAKPKTDLSRCNHCGLCASVCPMGSIDPEDVTSVPGICIKCQACVRQCPHGAKYFDDPACLSHQAMLGENFMDPKKNEVYFA